MKTKKNVIFAGIFALMSVTVFTFCKTPALSSADPKISKLLELTHQWKSLSKTYQPNHETDATWLNTGIRGKYAMAKKYASLKILESTFGTQVFLTGPHTNDLNFHSTTSFGHYNPAFINQLKESFKQALANPNYKRSMSAVYRSHLQRMANTYIDAYQHLNNDTKILESLKSKYTEEMTRPEGTLEGSFQETFRSYAEDLEKKNGADIYEAFTAPAFWLRRTMDGTASSWFELLKMVDSSLK